jgi:hypothetical protein
MSAEDETACWQNGSILWVEKKQAADGSNVCEIIYELDREPDTLRQMQLPQAAAGCALRRGQAVTVNLALRQIRER